MSIDITALDVLPETDPTMTDLAEQGLSRCRSTYWICWITCNNTDIPW